MCLGRHVFWQRQINSAALRLSQSASPCSMLNMSNICTQTPGFTVHTHLTTQLNFLHCCTSDTSRPPDAPLIKLSCHFGTHFYPLNLYTCPSPCMREPGLHMPLWPSPPNPLFWHVCARYLFKFLTPRGDRYVPPLPPFVFTACLCLSYVCPHMYEAANMESPPPARATQHTHFTGQSQLNHYQAA